MAQIVSKRKPSYMLPLQQFYKGTIARVAHNGLGTAVYDNSGFNLGFVENIGLKVHGVGHPCVDRSWVVFCTYDRRYRLNSMLDGLKTLEESDRE
jgi:hypothetical protein